MRTRRTAIAATLLVVVGLLAVCVAFGPAWIVDGTGLTVAERVAAENDVRSALIQGFVGFLALGAAGLGASVTVDQVRANRESRATDLFIKAIDLLASDQVSVRHGGVYALEQLSEVDVDERYRGHAHALLTAFIRQRAPWPPEKPDAPDAEPAAVPDDIGAALAVLGRQSLITEGAGSELERVDLRNAELDGITIQGACFAHANLAGASLVGASLVGATLADTILRGTDLTRANLRGADLTGADLTDARLRDADLDGVVADDTTVWPQGFTPPRPVA